MAQAWCTDSLLKAGSMEDAARCTRSHALMSMHIQAEAAGTAPPTSMHQSSSKDAATSSQNPAGPAPSQQQDQAIPGRCGSTRQMWPGRYAPDSGSESAAGRSAGPALAHLGTAREQWPGLCSSPASPPHPLQKKERGLQAAAAHVEVGLALSTLQGVCGRRSSSELWGQSGAVFGGRMSWEHA